MVTVAVCESVDEGPEPVARISIHSLGRFVMDRGGVTVSPHEWQSRKARDLVKILVSRRGRPITREALIETLWPEQNPRRTPNRLSVALSTARAALDPGRRLSAGHFIAADRYAVSLRCEQMVIDVERFLADARAGLAHYRAGRLAAARRLLEAAESIYGGDFLEEDLYEDWAVPLRDEARAAYVAVAGVLAELADADGDHQTATRHRLHVLERDPFDEGAHLALIRSLLRARRHGEALRAYARYVARMDQLGVAPAPFVGLPLTTSLAPASRSGRPCTTSTSSPRGRRRAGRS